MDDFKSFPKIEPIVKLHMTITQKIHGSNGQILIQRRYEYNVPGVENPLTIKAGSRHRWLTPDDDNHGFCKWVYANQEALISILGEGRHYGEWCGKGINAGEGLDRKHFILFDWWKYDWKDDVGIPNTLGLKPVPVLYKGKFSYEAIEETMFALKMSGSKLVPGYMKPEGIVIDINGQKFKKVFDAEETGWKRKDKTVSVPRDTSQYDYLLQPIRLEKLLSSDEKYFREYPSSLPDIARMYVQDLIDEEQITGDEDEIKAIRKAIGSKVFHFIKAEIKDIYDRVHRST